MSEGHTPMASAGRYQPLVLILAAAAAGIAIDRWRPLSLSVWSSIATIGLIATVTAWRTNRHRAAAIGLAVAIIAIGGARHHVGWYLFAADDLSVFADDEPWPVQVRGRLVGSPQRIAARPSSPLNAMASGERTQIRIEATEIRWGDTWRPASGRATLLVDGHVLGLVYGDEIEILGHLSTLSEPLNPGEWDFAADRRAAGELSRMWADDPECVTLIERPGGWSFWRGLERIRNAGRRVLDRYIDSDRQAVAGALLLGTRQQMDDELVEAYFLSGMIHLFK